MEKQKKLIFMRWWFWVIIIIVGITILIRLVDNDEIVSKEESTEISTKIPETVRDDIISETAIFEPTYTKEPTATPNNTPTPKPKRTSSPKREVNDIENEPVAFEQEVKVHFLDVGQADCIFIDYGEIDILIDGGNNTDGPMIVNYLKSLNTDDIELMIATHPHENHTGGLVTVINNFKIEKILKTGVTEDTQNNKDFENAIITNDIPTEWPNRGTRYNFGNLRLFIMSDKTKNYEDTNDFSIFVRMSYGINSFLFTGDAGEEVENELVEDGYNIKANVLKVANHGSALSSAKQFLAIVRPDYAVISVGKENIYSHPDPFVIDRLNSMDVAIMRTDEVGTIVFTSDGKDLSFEVIQTKKEVTANPTLTPEPTQ